MQYASHRCRASHHVSTYPSQHETYRPLRDMSEELWRPSHRVRRVERCLWRRMTRSSLTSACPIWGLPQAGVLHHPRQVWVHVDYAAYRRAYGRAFPNVDLTDLVLDHVMNRRLARLKGFTYLRIVPVSRAVNSSHGGLSEGWGVELHSSPRMRERNKTSQAVVRYADLADIVKMLDMEGGGSLMDIVNDAQRLVDLPRGT